MQEPTDLRAHIARSLHGRSEPIVRDAVRICGFTGMENVAGAERARIIAVLLQLVVAAVRDGTIDVGQAGITDVGRLAVERGFGLRPLLSITHLIERSVLDALALDHSLASEQWPALTTIVGSATLDVYAALSQQIGGHGGGNAATDPLTTLHTQAVFEAALKKEIQRSERFGQPFAVILLDVDRLAEINATQGYGAGDRIIERVGILVKSHLRTTDWVARLREDTFGVLLPGIQGANAAHLAERICVTVQERLQLQDHRSGRPFPVTLSVAVLAAESVDRHVDAGHVMAKLEEAILRAKMKGGNRVERTEVITAAAPSAPRSDAAIS